jgi:PTH1 family peptidyl-tRNA hydrolase
MLDWIQKWFSNKDASQKIDDMKYLIIGIGNIGRDYEGTRHNIGFEVADALADKLGVGFKNESLADVCVGKFKGRTIVVIKPTTYVNLSGKAANHWMVKHKIPKENLIVVLDDLNLDFGILRMRGQGSDGGHNGLKNIDQVLNGNNYTRLRIGIGNKFHKGQQVNYVLGKWSKEENEKLPEIIEKAADASLSFCAIGLKHTMEQYNGVL